MFYKFNNIIGRLAPSTQAGAYSPQGLTPLAREPSVITFDSKKTKPVQEPAMTMSRPASSAPAAAGEPLGVVPTHPRYQRVVELQNVFLRDDGMMVWQKFPRDRAVYYVTIGLLVVGSAALAGQLYKWSFPRKTQD
ncbi:cytochrome c oxidase subunit 7A2-like, mitochondrial [Babylonia areolata]|uniref:cytochrome c oxidase subunit 7A2-like, mitochondrial n=1 Tax=Babylonia areolata TaxID=304850 RepID=UPI003FD549F0